MAQQTNNDRWKNVAKSLGPMGKALNFTWRLGRMMGWIEILHITKNARGEEVEQMMHRVDLTDEDRNHLKNHGTLILAHTCGRTFQIKVPF